MKYVKSSDDLINFFGEYPLIASSIRTTKNCNAKCKHCYGDSGESFTNELTTEEIKGLIDQLVCMGVDKMFFTGGEPFTRPDIIELIHYANHKEMEILISSNAGLLTRDILKEIKDVNYSMFQLSLDGNRDIHDQIRGEGFYDKVIEVLEITKELNFKNITLATCLMKDNYNQLENIIDIVLKYQVPIYAFVLLLVAGRAEKELDVSSEQLKYSIDQIFHIYRKYGKYFKLAENSIIPPALVPADLRAIGLHKSFELCCAFPNILGVEANGDVAPCDGFFTFPEFIGGNIRKNSLEEIWNKSEVFQSLRQLDVTGLGGVCGKCIFLESCVGSCRASSYAYYGSLNAPFPTCQKLYEDGFFPKECLK